MSKPPLEPTTSSPMKSPQLIEALQEHLAKVQEVHTEALLLLAEISPKVKKRSEATIEELNDIGFLCRELGNLYDEMRKDANAHQDLVGKTIAYIRITETMNDENPDLTVRSNLATGTPKVRARTKTAKRGTPEYEALCRHFGVSEEAAQAGVFSAHYVHMGEYVSDLVEAGQPLPPGIELGLPVYSTTFKRRK